jgi:hypothetical protein
MANPRPRRWIGFFLALAIMGAIAIVVPIVYNLSIQLRPEQLAEARRLWQENAPVDYDLACLIKTEHEGEATEREVLVQVRGGRVVFAAEDNQLVFVDAALAGIAGPELLAASSQNASGYGVPALLGEIEAALRRDQTAGRRNFATARFDPRDGHPYHYVHRVRGSKERVEWNVKLSRVSAKAS